MLKPLFSVLLPFLLLTSPAARAADGPALVLPGGGVTDAGRKTGFFPARDGGIEALDLATGKVLWLSKAAEVPLLATADRVFARKPAVGKVNQFRLVALDATRAGKTVVESEPVVLPEWVSVTTAYGRRFTSFGRMAGGRFFLNWQAGSQYAGGARPPPEVEAAARKSASGVVKMDVATGQCELADAEAAPADEPDSAKVGELTLSAVESAPEKPRNPFERRRIVQATNAAGAVVWEHEIAAPIFLPPLP